MKVSRTIVITGVIASCTALAFAVHPAALFPTQVQTGGTITKAPIVAPSSHREAAFVHVPRTLVYVAGAVVHPGVYAVASDARASDALARAGGAKPDADLVAVNLAAHVADGDEIAVPHIGEKTTRVAHPRSARSRGSGTRRSPHRRSAERAVAPPPSSPDAMVDVNTADEPALAELPGIGPALAERIVAFRDANGPFASVDELADISGITSSRLDKILPFVTVR